MTTFITTTQFHAFLAAWKERANAKSLSAEDMLLHGLIRHGDIRGFTPITNQTKLANGADPSGALSKAAAALWSQLYSITRGKPSAGLSPLLAAAEVTPEQALRLQDVLREIQRGTFTPIAISPEGRSHA